MLRSFTAVYGARGNNPNFLTEDHPPESRSRLAWVRDKVEAEAHAFSFSKRYPTLGVSVLRLATLFGAGVHTFYTRIFSKRVVPVLLGYDPLVQLLHPEDALDAVSATLAKGPSGVLNVVPRDTLTLRTALHLSDKLTVSVPAPRGLPGRRLLVGPWEWARPPEGSSTTSGSSSWPRGRRPVESWASSRASPAATR